MPFVFNKLSTLHSGEAAEPALSPIKQFTEKNINYGFITVD
jgi:hypothetical protein